MGFNLRANYKRLSLAATLDWQKGGKMYSGTIGTMNWFGASMESLNYRDGMMVGEGIDEATGQKNTIEVSKQDWYMTYYHRGHGLRHQLLETPRRDADLRSA